METVLRAPFVRDPRLRRITVAVLAVVLAVLSVWPPLYVAKTEMVANDAGGTLTSLLGGGGLTGSGILGSLLGGRQSIEVDLTVARSQAVLEGTAVRLRREGRLKQGDLATAAYGLRGKLDIAAIRGGVLLITVRDHDRDLAKAIVTDYVAALRERLSELNEEQTAQKRAVVDNRLGNASVALESAQAALDQFRAANRLAAPEAQLGPAISLVTGLQATEQAEKAELQAQSQFATADNMEIKAARARLAATESQLAAAQRNAKSNGPTLGGLTPQLTVYENLYRDERAAEVEYEIYKKYLDSLSVEQLSATINLDVLDAPYLEPGRHFNPGPLGALVLLLLAAVLAEFYIARPPVGWARQST